MSFFNPQNPGLGGLDEITDSESVILQAITALGTSGQVLVTNSGETGVEWATASGTGDMIAATYDPATISEQLVGLTATQTLTNKTIDADNNTISNIALGAEATGALADLSDVTEDTVADGELLKYTTDHWENQTLAEAGIQGVLSEGAFVDGDKTKLDNIEAGADVTDATNVNAVESDPVVGAVTGIVKADGAGNISAAVEDTDYQGVLAEGAFADGDKTKLDNIEASADVTDTTNVTAAGALMDSEVTNLAQVKAFDSTDYATAAQGSTADSAMQDLVDDTTPQLGGDLDLNGNDIVLGDAVGETGSIRLNNSALSDEKWSGTTIAATAGATLAVGDVCYLASSGKWVLVDGILDGTDTGFDKKLGICVLASTDTNPTEILLDGVIASAAFPTFTVGSPVYLSDTAGDLTATQPSTTNFATRIVGYAVSATVLHFSPDNSYIVHV